MLNIIRNISAIALMLITAFATFGVQQVSAACTDYSCGTQCDNPKVDLVCQRSRLINPCTPGQDPNCCVLLYCGDTSSNTPNQIGNSVLDVNFFGIDMRIDEDKQVASFIYILFTFFFGFVALAVTLLGVYGSFLRSRAESPDDVAKASKLLTNAIVGLVLIVMALVIAQLVASALGIQSLDKLVDFSGVFQS